MNRHLLGRLTVYRARDRWTALGAATSYVAVGAVVRRAPTFSERRLFERINHRSADLRFLRIPQQFGTPWVLPALAAGALVARQPHLALAAALALPWEKGLEIGARKALPRFRPAQSDPAVRLRDDAPTEGPSYPSGHGGIAFAAVFLLAPCIPGPAAGALAALATATSFARVQQGAHYPADAVGGLLLGLTVASSLRSLVGHPA